ncbi:Release factor glutamine methyltransferase [Actinokineospora sp. UTMC 2448]|nr:Release factor glutamine methyltransferase [Actinokineospora sp. UTMC 2448]
MLLRMPGVYRPQGDTRLLCAAFHDANLPPGGTVLDIGTGTGAVALTAARAGAASVTAVDIARRAVVTARANAWLSGLNVEVRQGDALTIAAGRRFDIVLANPPYVPSVVDVDARGPARAWEGGCDGRAVLDRLCAAARDLLTPGGTLLMVHSALCGTEESLIALRGLGLKAAVVSRAREPFGPVMRGRADALVRAGLLEPGDTDEELVVIRADRAITDH